MEQHDANHEIGKEGFTYSKKTKDSEYLAQVQALLTRVYEKSI
jgi:hypothetical protein